jgi:SAM-dependent methyltransferase
MRNYNSSPNPNLNPRKGRRARRPSFAALSLRKVPYDSEFFAFVATESLRSARAVAPLVMDLLHPTSVVDIGCGVGAWLRAFVENGVSNITGIDGDYVDRGSLLIDTNDFIASDLSKPSVPEKRFDLALCIEVAEHLSESGGQNLVKRLTAAAPAVLFSAAIPGQGGVHHINEQWLGYWRKSFEQLGWIITDPFRPKLFYDNRVAWYIRQNLVLFLNEEWLRSRPALQDAIGTSAINECEWVHSSVYERWFDRANDNPGTKRLLRLLFTAMKNSLIRKLRFRSLISEHR